MKEWDDDDDDDDDDDYDDYYYYYYYNYMMMMMMMMMVMMIIIYSYMEGSLSSYWGTNICGNPQLLWILPPFPTEHQ